MPSSGASSQPAPNQPSGRIPVSVDQAWAASAAGPPSPAPRAACRPAHRQNHCSQGHRSRDRRILVMPSCCMPSTPLRFRFLVAMQGSLGIGKNLDKWSQEDVDLAKTINRLVQGRGIDGATRPARQARRSSCGSASGPAHRPRGAPPTRKGGRRLPRRPPVAAGYLQFFQSGHWNHQCGSSQRAAHTALVASTKPKPLS